MTISERELFMGLCFILSAFSKDKEKRACVLVKNKRIISSGFSSVDLLGELKGSPEFFCLSQSDLSFFTDCDVYLNYTPSVESVAFLSKISFKKLVFFDTCDADYTERFHHYFDRIIVFKENLNWIRDHIHLMKSFDIFS
jgi:hypothetical protein